jgi:enoyl-[acyl-carrier-protein] reductase (NADH)
MGMEIKMLLVSRLRANISQRIATWPFVSRKALSQDTLVTMPLHSLHPIRTKWQEIELHGENMQLLQGKVAIVSGASSGIGQGIAKRFGSEGAKVIVDYVGRPEGANDTVRAIERAGSEAETVEADVTSIDAVQRLVDRAWSRFGSADILVNNAGIEKKSAFWETTEADFDQVMAVNLRGPFFLSQAFVRRLRDAKKSGRIININY